MDNTTENTESFCPICEKTFPMSEIEQHVNKCIFLNSADSEEIPKRKRSPSPVLPQNFNRKSRGPQSKVDLISPSKKQKVETKTEKQPTTPRNNKTKSNKSLVVNELKPSITVTKATVANNIASATSTKASAVEKPKDNSFSIPLAKQLQPKSLDDFIGQNHVLGENTVLRALLEKGDIPNMILWGPPGCGKTSLSGVIQGICKSNPTKLKFVSLCAATAGVKDVQNVVSAAKLQQKFGCRTVLFMDEIHRFNKKQQDIFLLHVEKGDIVLIGATTENPSFTINSALLSRCRVIVMQKLEPDSLYSIIERAARNLEVKIIDDPNISLQEGQCDR